ncbi:MAG: hypothetical protein EP329_20235 [Deltaproteobacteria bacterium]|nr:MAG: hypothetical protein EP329_20235 [Deltaproteobacteria bacterium]
MPAFSAVDCIDAWVAHLRAYPVEGLTGPAHRDLEQVVAAAEALAAHVDRQVVMRDEDERTFLVIALARLLRRYADRERGRKGERRALKAVRGQALELEDRVRQAFPERAFPEAVVDVLGPLTHLFRLPPPKRMPGQLGLGL